PAIAADGIATGDRKCACCAYGQSSSGGQRDLAAAPAIARSGADCQVRRIHNVNAASLVEYTDGTAIAGVTAAHCTEGGLPGNCPIDKVAAALHTDTEIGEVV